MAEAFPLQWPMGRGRTAYRDKKYGQFKVGPEKIKRDLLKELSMMSVTNYVINSNSRLKADGMPYVNQQIEDTGVVLYFTRKGQEIAIACDKYYQVNDNLRAIGLSLGAIRGMERWGTEEMVDRAFTGFAALPASFEMPAGRTHREWWDVLGVDRGANALEVKAAYREALKLHHPDFGGDESDLKDVQRAYEEWKNT